MTYRQEMGHLATALGTLLKDGAAVPGDDIRAVLAGHSAVLSLLRQVHKDLPDIEHEDFLRLGYWLRRQPQVTDQPLSAVLGAESASPAGKLWREVAATSTVAQHDWQQSIPDSRPSGPASWSEAADVAALSEAVAVLYDDIASSLRAGARWRDADDFRAQQTGLVLAARNVRHLTDTMRLLKPAALQPIPSHRVLIHLAPVALPQALHRLAQMVASVHGITPGHAILASRVVAQTALAAAQGLQHAPKAAAALREHASRLDAVRGLDRRVAPLLPGDARVRAQAEQIHILMNDLRREGSGLTRSDARASAQAIPAVTLSLSQAAADHVASGDWVLIREVPGRSDRVMWRPQIDETDEPPLLKGLRHAGEHADILARNVRSVTRSAAEGVYPRHVLGASLDARTPSSPLHRHRVLPAPPPVSPPRRSGPPR